MVQYTLEANREGCVGMAANMIGVKKRVIIVNMGLVDLVMFNPVLLKADMSAWAGSFGGNYYLNQRDSKKAILWADTQKLDQESNTWEVGFYD